MTIAKTAQALSMLDLSPEMDRLSDIEAERKEVAAACERGRAKTMELSQQLAEIRDNRRDGEAEAQALRDGEDIAVIAKTEESIRGEREAVQAGMRALSADLDGLAKERQAVRDRAKERLAPAFNGLLADMDTEARQLAARLAQIFADAETIRAASGNSAATRLASALRLVVDEAACADLIGRSKAIAASRSLADLLNSHAGVIKTAGGALHMQHRTPRL